jgi:hypothetical protein
MAGVIRMSERELTRLRVLIDLSDRRLTVEAAGTLMGVGRRQVYRLRCALAADGPVALASRKRGCVSNHRCRRPQLTENSGQLRPSGGFPWPYGRHSALGGGARSMSSTH